MRAFDLRKQEPMTEEHEEEGRKCVCVKNKRWSLGASGVRRCLGARARVVA